MAKALLSQIYNLLWLLLAPLALCYFLLRSLKAPAYRQHLSERFGLVTIPPSQQGGLIIHAVSMGEVIAATPVIEGLLKEYPALPLTVTCMSPTGRAKIKNSFGHRVCCQYLPIDLPGFTSQWLDRLKPQALIIMETELWPNLLKACQQRLITTIVINARLSKKSAAGYRKHELIRQLIIGRIDLMLCQNRATQKRARALQLTRSSHTVGNLKFDYKAPEQNQKLATELQQQLNRQPLWVAGSTHAGEDSLIIEAFCQLKLSFPRLKLAIAPRHPERFNEVARLLEDANLQFGRRSEKASLNEHDIMLIDTMGELLSWYQVATAAFIGGSLIERGGHNPLEAMMFGCPVLSGPHIFNFAQAFRQLDNKQAVLWVNTSQELTQQMSQLLEQPALHQKVSQQGKALFHKQAGATDKTIRQIVSKLGADANNYRVSQQQGCEICQNETLLQNPVAGSFTQDFWEQNIIGHSSGRNTVWFIDNQGAQMVLRHYYRGGLIGKLIKQSFFRAPAARSRSFKEFRLLQRMAAEGLPVPKPVAALYHSSWLSYQASILFELLPNTQDLCHLLTEKELTVKRWQGVGQTIARMHNRQVFHSDLNCHNILMDKQGKVFLIDFDKCDYRQGEEWKSENLNRLLRSFNKEKGQLPHFCFGDQEWQQLLSGYKAAAIK